MTTPFFILQYMVSVVFALQNMTNFAVILIAFSYVTTSINYLLLNRSYNRIK
jgi:hypothetical protein